MSILLAIIVLLVGTGLAGWCLSFIFTTDNTLVMVFGLGVFILLFLGTLVATAMVLGIE